MLFKSTSLIICLQQNVLEFNLGIPPLTELRLELHGMLRTISISMSPVFQSFRCEHQWTIQQRSAKPYWKTFLKIILSFNGWFCIWTFTTKSNHHGASHHSLSL